ncbi:MAG: OsmC family protein [Candidatus Thorarchaeota archaeon]|nr:MAG: OsmC family protein [Candidatus Thorarchaeota archaeon]
MRIRARYPESGEYFAESDWDGQTGGTAITKSGESFAFDTPKIYGGRGKGVCPDELFVSAVLGCLTNTFLDFQRRFEMQLRSIHLEAKASTLFDNEGYTITQIRVSGDVVVGKDELDVGERCVKLMKNYCHLTRSIRDCIPLEYNINVREE